MLAVLTVLSVLVCSQAKPNLSPEDTQLLDAPYVAVTPEADVCPPGYTFFPDIREWSFTRGVGATRDRIPLKNPEALLCENSTQCEDLTSLPDTVECQMKAVDNGFDWSCSAPKNSALAIADPVVLCESADSTSPCILNGSCVLRYRIRSSKTWTIVAVVTGVILALGLIAFIVAFAFRRR